MKTGNEAAIDTANPCAYAGENRKIWGFNVDKTSTGLPENVAGLLCYVLGWVSGIVFLIIEPENKFIRFHARQSIIVFGILSLAGIALSPIPFIGPFFGWIIYTTAFILWIVLIVMAVQGKLYKLPWVGDLAQRWAG